MSLAKNFYDKSVPTRNLVTTITGIITAVISLLVLFGVLSPEQSGQLTTHALNLVTYVTGIWGTIAAVILMFRAKDV